MEPSDDIKKFLGDMDKRVVQIDKKTEKMMENDKKMRLKMAFDIQRKKLKKREKMLEEAEGLILDLSPVLLKIIKKTREFNTTIEECGEKIKKLENLELAGDVQKDAIYEFVKVGLQAQVDKEAYEEKVLKIMKMIGTGMNGKTKILKEIYN